VPEESGAAGSSGQGAPRSPERARQQDSAGAIYGSMAAAAVIAASGRHLPPGQVLALTLSTLLTFWLAHVYARVLAHHLQAATGLRWDIVVAAMVEEWPMVAAPAPALAVLLLGAVGVLEEHLAVNLALWVGVAQLVGWGYRLRAPPAVGLAHRLGHRRDQRDVRGRHHRPQGVRALIIGRIRTRRLRPGRAVARRPGGWSPPRSGGRSRTPRPARRPPPA
jgi:hypothetical protein